MSLDSKGVKKVREAFSDLKKYRGATTQTSFWARYGVTQSGGSRYEGGRGMDKPLRALMALHISGVIDEATLAKALATASEGDK